MNENVPEMGAVQVSDGKFLYLYCFIPTAQVIAEEFPMVLGIDEHGFCHIKQYGDVTAVVSKVDGTTFSQVQLESHVRDPEWVKKTGTCHHECISRFHEKYTVLPVSLCTIFSNEETLEATVVKDYQQLIEKFRYLKEKHEWNLRMYVNRKKLQSYIEQRSAAVSELQDLIGRSTPGKQFFVKKKLEQLVMREANSRVFSVWEALRSELSAQISADIVVRENWPKELTLRTEDMVANGVMLIAKGFSQLFEEVIENYAIANEGLGLSFEYSGPWPPYHFASVSRGA